jgi:hypothetical protein
MSNPMLKQLIKPYVETLAISLLGTPVPNSEINLV